MAIKDGIGVKRVHVLTTPPNTKNYIKVKQTANPSIKNYINVESVGAANTKNYINVVEVAYDLPKDYILVNFVAAEPVVTAYIEEEPWIESEYWYD